MFQQSDLSVLAVCSRPGYYARCVWMRRQAGRQGLDFHIVVYSLLPVLSFALARAPGKLLCHACNIIYCVFPCLRFHVLSGRQRCVIIYPCHV